MIEEQTKILHIDATIELRDYFHAYFDAAKTKLIIAGVICASVIAAVTYFFLLIGEREILLKLSPLFFGFPIIAVVGQFLRVHASCRKYLADLTESEKNVHYMFSENNDGFDIVRGKNFSHVAWGSVRRVVEKPHYFRFMFNKYDSLIVPKRFLRGQSDETFMKDIIRSHLGDKAKLLRD